MSAAQRAAMLGTPGADAFGGLARVAARVLGASSASVLLLDGSELRVAACAGPGGALLSGVEFLPDSPCRHLLPDDDVVLISDLATCSFPDLQALLVPRGFGSLAARCVRGRDGSLYGALCVADPGPRSWTDEDADLLRDLAATATASAERLLEAQRAREELAVRSAYLEQLFEAAPEGVVILDNRDVVLRANSEFLRMFGYTRAEVVGRPINELIVDDQHRDEAAALSKRAVRGDVIGGEVVRTRKNGSRIDVSVLASPIRTEEGQVAVYAIYRDITGRREVEAALERSEQRFRSLIESSADAILVLGAGGVVEYASPSLKRMLGYDPVQLHGKNGLTPIHPDDAPVVIERFTRLMRGDETGPGLECRVATRDGRYKTLSIRGRNLLHDPAIRGLVINLRDVSAERRAEESRRRLNALLEATPDFVAIFDPHGRALSINAAFRQVVGLAADADLAAVTLTDCYPQDTTELLLHEGIPTAVRDGVWIGEARLLRVGAGEQIPVSQMILAHKAPSGAVEFLSALARDISEQKAAELRLRESEQHFRSLIENALDMITVADAQGRIIFESPSVERVLGYTPGELQGMDFHDLLHPEDAQLSRQVMAHPDQSRMRVPAEVRVRHKDGSWRVLESVANDRLDDPAVGGIVINSRDVTERRAAEDALRESQEQLLQSQKMEAVGRLAGGVAHDFNNLLTAIKGFTELLLLDFDERDPRKPFVTEIQSAANRAAALTRQLLAFSRKQVLQPKVLDLNAVVSDIERMLRRLIGEDVELHTATALEPALTRADPGQVEQVVLNLVVNARDAMPGGGRITLRSAVVELGADHLRPASGAHPGRFVQLSVTDTGTGMPPEVMEKIFEPFFTTKGQGKGTGLGLSTVYGIVSQSGGFVDVESEPGRGTTFRVYLPAAAEAAPAVPVSQDAPADLDGRETVLLVEDEPAVRVLVRRVLDRKGYRVLEADNGAAALRLLDDHGARVDLLLTDVVMPGMSGRELANHLTARLPDLQVLYMSGYTDDAIVHHGVLDEDVNFIEKPFTPELLLRKLREVLARSGAARR